MQAGGYFSKPNLKLSRPGKFSNSREKAQYASKVKFYTIQPPQDASDPTGNRLMLGLKDPKDDSFCEYEQRPVVTKPKKPKTDSSQKENYDRLMLTRKNSCPLIKRENEFSGHTSNITVQDVKAPQQTAPEPKDKDAIGFYNSPEQNEENSKAFMESIGSWINDFFNAPNKKSELAENEKEPPKEQTIKTEDPEYLKSISEIKEQFRKKLTRVTSVHVSTPEKPFDLNFDTVLGSGKRKRTTSLPPSTPHKWWEEFSDIENQVAETSEYMAQDHGSNHHPAALLIRTAEVENLQPKPLPAKNNLEVNNSNLVKKKRKARGRNRSELNDFEEYVFPTSAELSRRILLNIQDKEKCVPSYKNSHLGVQETQPYAQVKKKAYQSNARCYTTNANITEISDSSKQFSNANRFPHVCTTDAAAIRGATEVLNKNSLGLRKTQTRRPSRKTVSELSRDSMTFIKVKSPKSLSNVPAEQSKGDVKSSSDELVKYLMKKIKTNHRAQQPKKKGSINVPQVLSSPKNRFMQSATNSLVMSVIAKNDNPAKNAARIHPDNKLYPGKELFVKYPENNIRFDVSRAVNQKFSKCTYLLEGDRVTDDTYLLDKSNYKNRRPFDDLLKRESKKTKRQEIKNMFSNLDMKFNVFQVPKSKPKEPKRKPIQVMSDPFESEDVQNGRFKKQHELFRTNLKVSDEAPGIEQNPITEPEKEIQPETASLLPAELAVIDTNLQLAPEEKTETEQSKSEPPTPKEPEYKIIDCLGLEEKPKPEPKLEKPMLWKDKMQKPKSMQYLKDNDSKMLLSPLAEFRHVDNQTQKDVPKPYDTSMFPSDLRPVKPGETALLNRRFSTNILEPGSKVKAGTHKMATHKATLYLADLEKDGELEKDAKDKTKKKKTTTTTTTTSGLSELEGSSSDNHCRFEKVVKKPAPNCDKEQQ